MPAFEKVQEPAGVDPGSHRASPGRARRRALLRITGTRRFEMSPVQSRPVDMEFVDFPGTSIRASRIALGTWAIGGWMWENDAIRTIHSALDQTRAPHQLGTLFDHFVSQLRTGSAVDFVNSHGYRGPASCDTINEGRRCRIPYISWCLDISVAGEQCGAHRHWAGDSETEK